MTLEVTPKRKGGGSSLPAIKLEQDVYSLALERMEHVFDSFDQVMISFSGGKDSTAALNIALEVAHSHPRHARHLPLRVIFYDEEGIATQTEEYVRRVSQRPDVALEWYCLPVKHRNAASRRSPWWHPWAPEYADKWCRPLPPEAITTLPGFNHVDPDARLSIPDTAGLLAPPSAGNTVMILGIRAQESLIRLRAVRRRKGDNYIIPFNDGTAQGNLWKAYPIYDWTTEDVWTAPKIKGWDYNHCYDHMEMMGIPHHAQRCSPPFGEEPLGNLHMWAQCFPEVWDKMVERVPGVGAALRYAKTELWAFRAVPEKPAGVSWVDFLLNYVGKFDPKTQQMIGDRLTETVRRHYQKTTLPIVVKQSHPLTGVSWNYLLKLAMRGDFKERNQPEMRLKTDGNGNVPPYFWHNYVSEIRTMLEDGTFSDLAYPGRLPADLDSIIPDYAKELNK